ncbi:MAG: substrate-binding domain-containing protein [Planctomycetes bacterium]|nr:substrate-binding domain-containing protein [Planctomycetota bacterium]
MVLLLTAGCGLGDDPDPRAHAPRTFALVARPWQPPVPVTEAVAPAAAAAPQVETRRPSEVVGPMPIAVAMGLNARQVIDGALERTFAAGQPNCSHTFTPCTDRDAVELVLMGRADFAVIGEQLSGRELQAGLQQTRFGLELFAVAVAADSPVRSLTRSQVRQIFTGQVTSWQQLGFTGGTITAVVPSEPRLAERAARALIPGDAFLAGAARVASDRHVADQILQHSDAIGVVHVTDRPPTGMRLLAIDWCPPTAEAFGYGTYPFGVPLQVVTAGPPTGEARRFLEFVATDATRERLAAQLTLP